MFTAKWCFCFCQVAPMLPNIFLLMLQKFVVPGFCFVLVCFRIITATYLFSSEVSKILIVSQAWWRMPFIPVLGRQTQEDPCELGQPELHNRETLSKYIMYSAKYITIC